MLELKNTLLQKFSNQDICAFHLQNQIFDGTQTPSQTVISLSVLREGASATSAAIVTAGQPLATSNYGLVVNTIRLGDIRSTGVANEYSGMLAVSFTAASMVGTSRGAATPIRFRVDPASPITARRISDCLPQQNVIRRFDLPLSTLALYHTWVGKVITACTGGTLDTTPWTLYMHLQSACTRYCSSGCPPGGNMCSGYQPGKGFSGGGTVGELDCGGLAATCICI